MHVVQAVQGRRRAIESLDIAPLYNYRLPITLAKKNDPLSLLRNRVIPTEYKNFYEGYLQPNVDTF